VESIMAFFSCLVISFLTASWQHPIWWARCSWPKAYDWLQVRPAGLDKIESLINRTRQLKKLPTVTLDNLTERKTTPDSTSPKAGRTWLKILLGSE
jgi:hypothetical protein